MTEVTRAPSWFAGSLALGFGAVGVAASGLTDGAALLVGAAGLLSLVAGVARASRRFATLGGAGLLGSVLVAGLGGAGPEALLVGLLGGLLAWDTAEFGIGVGEQLGRETETRRLVVVHAGASLIVGALAAGVGYGVYLRASGGQPVTALVFLLLGGVALAAVLRR